MRFNQAAVSASRKLPQMLLHTVSCSCSKGCSLLLLGLATGVHYSQLSGLKAASHAHLGRHFPLHVLTVPFSIASHSQSLPISELLPVGAKGTTLSMARSASHPVSGPAVNFCTPQCTFSFSQSSPGLPYEERSGSHSAKHNNFWLETRLFYLSMGPGPLDGPTTTHYQSSPARRTCKE